MHNIFCQHGAGEEDAEMGTNRAETVRRADASSYRRSVGGRPFSAAENAALYSIGRMPFRAEREAAETAHRLLSAEADGERGGVGASGGMAVDHG